MSNLFNKLPTKEKELNITQELASIVYLGVYKKLIDAMKPSMGLVDVDKELTLRVLGMLLSQDLVIDITKFADRDMPRASIRSYIATASSADKVTVAKAVLDIVLDPKVPAYFKGFREVIIKTIITKVYVLKWGMGDIQAVPYIITNELGLPEVGRMLNITMRLRR